METSIIKIGNSKGLRLNKTILEKYGIKDKVELILEKGQIILKPIKTPRKDWEKEFKKIAEAYENLTNKNINKNNLCFRTTFEIYLQLGSLEIL